MAHDSSRSGPRSAQINRGPAPRRTWRPSVGCLCRTWPARHQDVPEPRRGSRHLEIGTRDHLHYRPGAHVAVQADASDLIGVLHRPQRLTRQLDAVNAGHADAGKPAGHKQQVVTTIEDHAKGLAAVRCVDEPLRGPPADVTAENIAGKEFSRIKGGARALRDALADLAQRHQDDRAHRNALTLRGMVAISHDDGVKAVNLLEDALSLARRGSERWLLATSQLNLRLAHLCMANTDSARAAIGDALQAYEEIGDQRFHARCLGYLGHAALIDRDTNRASALLRSSLATFRHLAQPGGTAEGLVGLAAVQALHGNATRAAMLAGAAERIRNSYAGRQVPLDERVSGRYLAVAEDLLGPEEWSRAWAAGRELQLDSAIELALE
jgi:hypothetical protein